MSSNTPQHFEQYFDRVDRLHKMNDEFVTIDSPVDLHYDMNLNNIVLSIDHGILEDHNFFNIIHKYDFEISTIIYDKKHNIHTNVPLRMYGSPLLICLEDRKEFT
jgi:hypothetical protein